MKTLVILSAACGVGKSAVTDALRQSNLLQGFVCMGSDEMGLNWWDYAGTDHEFGYIQDGMDEALRRAGERNLLFTTCMSPVDFYAKPWSGNCRSGGRASRRSRPRARRSAVPARSRARTGRSAKSRAKGA